MSTSQLLPLFLNLKGRRVLVVGGGPVAASKLSQLLAAGAEVHLVSPELCADIDGRRDAAGLVIERRGFEVADLDGVWLVVAAGTPEVNRRIAEAAEGRRLFVNAVDDPANATAFLSGVVRRDGVTLAISTEGAAPGLTALLRQAFDRVLPEDLAAWVDIARGERGEWRRAGVPMADRRPLLLQALNTLYRRTTEDSERNDAVSERPASPSVPAVGASAATWRRSSKTTTERTGSTAERFHLAAGSMSSLPSGVNGPRTAGLVPDKMITENRPDSSEIADQSGQETTTRTLLSDGRRNPSAGAVSSASSETGRVAPGHVSLVGAGPGDPGLLTRRAVARLRAADLVLYDALIDRRVLRLARRAQRFFVGKRARRSAMSQQTINGLMIRAARRGKRVVRLKGGDPFVFGRGGEEALALQAAGISVDVVPGVTSAVAAPALAGIPVTHRGVSSAFLVVGGHDVDAFASAIETVAPNDLTLVVLMGVGHRGSLARRLVERGWHGTTPAAIIVDASRATQTVWRGTLEDLAAERVDIEQDGPGTMVIGQVVAVADEMGEPGRLINSSSGH